jgi:hypothetical protein
MFDQTLMTCRFCKESSFDTDKMVKYGVRHYAHFKCYLDAGKSLDDLHSWQVGQFPYRLLKERGLAGFANNVAKGMATAKTLGLS